MGHVEENARHDVEHEIPPQRGTAQAEKGEHDVEGKHEDGGLHHVRQDRQQGVAMRLADVAHDAVVDQFGNGDGSAKTCLPEIGMLKHNRLLPA